MAEDEDPTAPSLEPPSLFRRKKKQAAPPPDDSPTTILDDVGPVSVAPGPKPTAPPLFADEAPAAPPASSDAHSLVSGPENHGSASLDAPAPHPHPHRRLPSRRVRRVRGRSCRGPWPRRSPDCSWPR